MWRFGLLSIAVCCILSGCATTAPSPPAIQRLPEGAGAPIGRPTVVTPDEIVALARSGTPSSVIIQKLRDARMPPPSAEQISLLAARGVPADVVHYLRSGEEIIPPPYAWGYPVPAYPAYPYYGFPSYRPYSPYWGYPYGAYPYYPRSGVFLGFSRWW